MSNSSSNIIIYPKYELTNFNKKIITSLTTVFNSIIETQFSIIYKELKLIRIPEKVTFIQKMPGMNQELHFSFDNIALK